MEDDKRYFESSSEVESTSWNSISIMEIINKQIILSR